MKLKFAAGLVLCSMAIYQMASWAPGGVPHEGATPPEDPVAQDQVPRYVEVKEGNYEAVAYQRVKMNMVPQFNLISQLKREVHGRDGLARGESPLLQQQLRVLDSGRAAGLQSFDGAQARELPVINQHMCGSCWAIASSLALKANLKLKDHGMGADEVPSINRLIACSQGPYELVNQRNDARKMLMDLGLQRIQTQGCSGGVTGMALAALQLDGAISVESVSDYVAGRPGTLDAGPVVARNTMDKPGVTCSSLGALPRQKLPNGVKLQHLDLVHLARRDPGGTVAFPHTRDVREFIFAHGAVVVYADIDSGLDSGALMGASVAKLPRCKWRANDYQQTDSSDYHSMSQFKAADHAMLLTGWDCKTSTWTVRNSWGAAWGLQGTLGLYDANVCSEEPVISAHSYGAGPGCIFGSSISAFTAGP